MSTCAYLIAHHRLASHHHLTIMAKKKSATVKEALDNESNVPPILEVAYSDPLFSVAAHPTKPIVLAGLGTGHLFCHSYDAESLEEKLQAAREQAQDKSKNVKLSVVSQLKKKWWTAVADHQSIDGSNGITTNWKTKRHKGSCRSVIFDINEGSVGDYVYSVGKDHTIKKAATETGRVTAKSEISSHYDDAADAVTNLAISPTHPFLLAGTENGLVLVFDSNELSANKLKFKLPGMHEDAINKILPMPDVSAYHYLTLGSTTLTHLDIRKGAITQSDDQADELLSMCYASDHVNDHKNDTVLVSHGEGIVTLWRNSNNMLMDQISRVKVNKNASIDAIISTMQAGTEDMRDSVWCGDSEGLLHRVNYKRGKVVETRVHSSLMGKLGGLDEVGGLEIDYDYRLISSGMEGLKIWSSQAAKDQEFSDIESGSDSDSDSDSNSDDGFGSGDFSDSDVASDSEAEIVASDAFGDSENGDLGSDSEEEEKPQIIRRKRQDITQTLLKPKKKAININRITAKGSAQEEEHPKKKQKQMKPKAVPNNGIAKFEGL